MSDKYTEVSVEGAGGLGFWGFEDPEDAIKQTRKHAERELERAQKMIDGIDAGRVKVFQQYGPYAGKKRRQVWPIEKSDDEWQTTLETKQSKI